MTRYTNSKLKRRNYQNDKIIYSKYQKMLINYKDLLWRFADDKYITLIAIIFLILWAYCILRVAKDISNRTKNNPLRFLSLVLIAATWPLWLPIYILIRPYWYLYQKKSITIDNQIICDNCKHKNNISNDFCIFCWDGLKVICKECKNTLPSNYQYCCKCGAPNL